MKIYDVYLRFQIMLGVVSTAVQSYLLSIDPTPDPTNLIMACIIHGGFILNAYLDRSE